MTGILPDLVGLVDDAADAAPVIDMRMRIDHGRYGKALAHMLLEQLPCGASGLLGHQGVIDDPAGLAADEGHVGQVDAADLVDARDDLVETVIVVQFGYAQQRGMNAVEIVLLVEELKPLHVPGDVARVRHDLEVRHGSDQPLLLLLEILGIAERQLVARLLEHIQSKI